MSEQNLVIDALAELERSAADVAYRDGFSDGFTEALAIALDVIGGDRPHLRNELERRMQAALPKRATNGGGQ